MERHSPPSTLLTQAEPDPTQYMVMRWLSACHSPHWASQGSHSVISRCHMLSSESGTEGSVSLLGESKQAGTFPVVPSLRICSIPDLGTKILFTMEQLSLCAAAKDLA